MKIICTFFLLLALPVCLGAQSVAWMNAYHMGIATDVDVHADGRTIAAVNSSMDALTNVVDGTTAFGASVTTNACWLLAFNADGSADWSIAFPFALSTMRLNDIEFAPDGSVYVCGAASANADFDPSDAVVSLSSSGVGFLAKYSATGQFMWAIPMADYDPFSSNYLRVDSQANVYMTGYFTGSYDFNPGSGQSVLTAGANHSNTYVCKFNASGELQWAKAIVSGNHVYPTALALNGNNQLLVGGVYSPTTTGQSALDLDPGSGQFPVQGDELTPGSTAFFSLLDGEGAFVAGYGVEEVSLVVPNAITATADNGFAIIGNYTRNFDANFAAETNTVNVIGPQNFSDIFILKVSENLSFQWVKSIGSSNGNHAGSCIRELPGGDLMASGYSNSGNLDIDPGTDEFVIEGGLSLGATGFLLRLDATGLFVWGEQASNGGLCYVYSLAAHSNGDLAICVSAPAQVTFSPHLNYTQPMQDPTLNNVFLIGKIQFGLPSGIAQFDEPAPALYPQPAIDHIFFTGRIDAGIPYSIVNTTGQTVAGGIVYSNELSIETLPAGYYLILLDQRHVIPFVKGGAY